MSSFISSVTGGGAAKQAQQTAQYNAYMQSLQQAQTQAAAAGVNSTFDREFTPDFYKKQQQNYLDHEMPQLNKQYGDAQKALTFPLDRSGTLNSSARSQQEDNASGRTYDSPVDTAGAAAAGYINGLPIAGPYLLGGVQRTAAAIRSMKNDSKFSDELSNVQGITTENAAAHP